MTDTDSKWIEFIEQPKTGKTQIFNIVPKEQPGSVIGQIKWYGAWRKYCFFPSPSIICIFETQCLGDIISFINKLMFKWKVEQQNKKQNS
jgi:hypothetical protein